MPAPEPPVLLVHGFGQDRRQWDAFVRERLLPAGFAALTLDLRGHGASKEKAGASLNAEASWSSDPKQFPLDINTAIQNGLTRVEQGKQKSDEAWTQSLKDVNALL